MSARVLYLTLALMNALVTSTYAQNNRHTSVGTLLTAVLRADAGLPYPDTAGRTLFIDIESFVSAAAAIGASGIDVHEALASAGRPFRQGITRTQHSSCDEQGCRYADNPLILQIEEIKYTSGDTAVVLLNRFFNVHLQRSERYTTGCMTYRLTFTHVERGWSHVGWNVAREC